MCCDTHCLLLALAPTFAACQAAGCPKGSGWGGSTLQGWKYTALAEAVQAAGRLAALTGQGAGSARTAGAGSAEQWLKSNLPARSAAPISSDRSSSSSDGSSSGGSSSGAPESSGRPIGSAAISSSPRPPMRAPASSSCDTRAAAGQQQVQQQQVKMQHPSSCLQARC